MKFRYLLLSLTAVAALNACSDEPASAPPAVADNEQVQNRGANQDNWWDSLPRPE